MPVNRNHQSDYGNHPERYLKASNHAHVDIAANRFYIGCDLGHEVAGVFFVVVGKAHVLQLVVHRAAHVVSDFLGKGVGAVGPGEVYESPGDAGCQQNQA